MSKTLGVQLNPVTSGPLVNECLETSVEGIFACGNVLHVHDLVDFVSQEAAAAGTYAASYIKNSTGHEKSRDIPISAESGVRYTVPNTVHPQRMEEKLTVRFRVGDVYKNCYVSVYVDEKRIIHRKKQVMAPGEMEEVILNKEELEAYPGMSKITVKLEED